MAFSPHSAYPLRRKVIASARLKDDKAGAAIPAPPPRDGLPPEAWIAAHQVRQPRALLRHRHPAWCGCGRRRETGSTPRRPGDGHSLPGGRLERPPGCAWHAALEVPVASREVIEGRLSV